MAPSAPYQSLLLRLLHGAIAVVVLAAWTTGFWVYNLFDKRWGTLPLPEVWTMQDIHGTLALGAFLWFPLFGFYSFHLGDRRLMQDQSWRELGQWREPKGWIAWHRLANTLMLVALTLAILSGRMMDETWLPKGELDHRWYYAHLLGWLGVILALAFHVLLGARVGGLSLLLSMVKGGKRSDDNPKTWLQSCRWTRQKTLLTLEILLGLSWLMALLLPLVKA